MKSFLWDAGKVLALFLLMMNVSLGLIWYGVHLLTQ